MQITPDWISGFTDGEGCFTVHCQLNKGKRGYTLSVAPIFRISLSKSDGQVLHQICQELGVGRVPDSKGYTSGYGKIKWPKRTYCVTSVPECLVLRDFFNSHPLHTKKKETFEYWSQCLDLMGKGPLTREDLKKLLHWRDKMNPGNKRQQMGKTAYRDARHILNLLDKGTCQLSLGSEAADALSHLSSAQRQNHTKNKSQLDLL